MKKLATLLENLGIMPSKDTVVLSGTPAIGYFIEMARTMPDAGLDEKFAAAGLAGYVTGKFVMAGAELGHNITVGLSEIINPDVNTFNQASVTTSFAGGLATAALCMSLAFNSLDKDPPDAAEFFYGVSDQVINMAQSFDDTYLEGKFIPDGFDLRHVDLTPEE